MSLPLKDSNKCFNQYYPKCLGERTHCPYLQRCHIKYSEVVQKDLLRTIDDGVGFWMKVFTGFVVSIPIIYIILLFIGAM